MFPNCSSKLTDSWVRNMPRRRTRSVSCFSFTSVFFKLKFLAGTKYSIFFFIEHITFPEGFCLLQKATDGVISQLLNIKVFSKIQIDPRRWERRSSEAKLSFQDEVTGWHQTMANPQTLKPIGDFRTIIKNERWIPLFISSGCFLLCYYYPKKKSVHFHLIGGYCLL